MNGQVEFTWQTLQTIPDSMIKYARVYGEYIHFSLMYTTDHTLPVLPIKNLVKQDGEPTTPQKLSTGTKPSVSNLCFLFLPYVVRKEIANVDTKALNMRHQSQKCFRGISVEVPKNKRVPNLRTYHKEIVSSQVVVFDKQNFRA